MTGSEGGGTDEWFCVVVVLLVISGVAVIMVGVICHWLW